MIKVSETAKQKVVSLMTESGFDATTDYVRVGVKSGGCSGLSYELDFDKSIGETDKIFEDNAVRIIVDKKSFLYLVGTTLEYSGGLNGKGFVFNTVLTLGLKEVVKKERPNGENLNSFPSGHTSVTFQSAAFMQKRYGWKYGIPAYAIAAYTGFSRVYVDKHFVEDVAVGAVIGIVSSYIFTRKKTINSTSFSFNKKGNDFYLSYHYQF